jgi:hypothetical protein
MMILSAETGIGGLTNTISNPVAEFLRKLLNQSRSIQQINRFNLFLSEDLASK